MNKTIAPLASFRFATGFLLTLALALAAELSFASAKADTLPVDTSFHAPLFAKVVPPDRALLQPDGKYLLLFDPDTLTDQAAGPITRYLADGTLDNSFNFSREYKNVTAAALAGDGKLYIAATRYVYGALDTEQMLRLNADGSIDSSFTPATVSGGQPFSTIQQVLVQPDGKVLVAGSFLTFSGNDARDGIVRLMTDGTIDQTFQPVTVIGFVNSAALQSDGKILVGGTFSSVNGVTDPGLARLNADGSLDSGFLASGFARSNNSSRVRGIVVQPDGLIVISGSFRTGTGPSLERMAVLRLNATGPVDSSFSSVGVTPSIGTGREMLQQPDGKFIVAIDNSVYRLNTNGSNDTSFRQPVIMNATFNPPTLPGIAVTVQRYPDGDILVGGIFTDVDPPADPNFAHTGAVRLNSDGTVDSSLVSSHRTGVEVAPSNFARLADGSTLVTFPETIDPSMAYNVGRLSSDGSRDPNFTLTSSDPSRFLNGFSARGLERLADGNFFAYGISADLGPRWGKVRPDGTEDTSFQTNSGVPAQEATAAPDGKVVLTAGTDAQTTIFTSFGRLRADGQVDAYGTTLGGQVIRNAFSGMIDEMNVGTNVLAIQPDGKVLLQFFAQDKNFHLIRINADGSIDGTFTETVLTPTGLTADFPVIFDPINGIVYQPASGVWTATRSLRDAYVQPDGRIIVTGHFTTFGSTTARGVVRLMPDGNVDPTFNTGNGAQWSSTTETATFFPTVENIEPAGNGKFLLTGTFEAFNGTPAPGIVRLNADGPVDTSFVAPVQRNKRSLTASAFRAQPDGSYLLSGPYTFAGESTSRSLIRLRGLAPNVGNISTRLVVGTDDNALIEGFIVQGPAGSSKKLMIRAIGPSLAQFGIPDALANPTLEIHDADGTTVATNNDWKTTQIGGLITGSQFPEINTSGLAPGNDFESAIIASLEPGSYTAVVRGAGNTVGTGVVDAFDLSTGSAARLANIATRGLVQPGDGLMIAGFIVQNGAVQVVVRAIGPSLADFGISNALPDTTLQLRDQQGSLVLENDDWRTSQQQELESLGLQPTHNLEAALVATIQPGQYTAQVRGKGQATGIGVVQVYFIQ